MDEVQTKLMEALDVFLDAALGGCIKDADEEMLDIVERVATQALIARRKELREGKAE